MKHHRPALFAVLCSLAIVLAAVATAVSAQTSQFDIALTTLETEPANVRVGEETLFVATLANVGETAVPADYTADLLLTVINLTSNQALDTCRQSVTLSDMQPAEIRELGLSDCSPIFIDENAHRVRIELLPSGAEPGADGSFTPLEGDANPDNNGLSETFYPAPYQSNLPAELGAIFAGLGIFIAVMSIVAVGTEVVIDTFKVAVGLKSKVTAMDALDRMEKYMPGQLATLGVSAGAQRQFQTLTQEMRTTLAQTLRPVEQFGLMRQQVRAGQFGDAYAIAEALVPYAGDVAASNLNTFRRAMNAFVNKIIASAKENLQLNPQVIDAFGAQLQAQVASFEGKNPGHFLEDFFTMLQDAHFWSVEIADGWLEKQMDAFFTTSTTAVMQHFEANLKPFLLGIGFAPNSVHSLQLNLQSQLQLVQAGVDEAADSYLTSLRNVLDAVELRRFNTQSPARKIWRLLRNWEGGEVGHLRGMYGTIAMALLVALLALGLTWLFLPQPLPLGIDMRVQAISPPGWLLLYLSYTVFFIVVIVLLGELAQNIYNGRVDHNHRLTDEEKYIYKQKVTNITSLLKVETLYNLMRTGFDYAKVDPAEFDKPYYVSDYEHALQAHLNEENVAQFVLARNDQQRDEETSRLRWLRVISFVIGFVIAYLLQIDALRLLGQAFPGFLDSFNFVILTGEQLNSWRDWLSPDKVVTVGIVLTAFAAAAGSAFWHDRLDQLQATKKGAESAAELMQEASQVLDSVEKRR